MAENINTTAYWNSVYQKEWENQLPFRPEYSRNYLLVHDKIIALIPDGYKVLDIACGSGVLCRKLREQRPHAEIWGVDFSDFIIAKNRELDSDRGINYICLDIREELHKVRMKFDVIIMSEIIEHLEAPKKVVDAAVALLKNNGLFILTCPHDMDLVDKEHLRFWGHDSLFHFLAEYSDEITFVKFPRPYSWDVLAYFKYHPNGASL